MNLKELLFYISSHGLGKCIYCRKIRFCAYIDYRVIENGKHDRGIKGNFCIKCEKRTHEDIFKKLKDEQYYIFKSINASWNNIKEVNQ